MNNEENYGKLKIKDFDKPEPINKESKFEYDELFFSVTDSKSTITFANDLFVRISKYTADEIIGQLHKLIRHPDMPRSVFHIFWEHLKSNKPVAAYVKNMAKDGSYYWVMALAFPCDGGYLSVRLKPGSDLFEKVKKIYTKTLQHEKKMEKQGDKKDAMHSSLLLLTSELNDLGFADYDEFMWNALQSEMEHREKQLTKNNVSDRSYALNVPRELLDLESILRELVLMLGQLKQMHESLVGHSEYILNLSRSVLLLSMNAQVGSSKLDRQDRSLSVVAEKMGEQSITGEKQLLDMQENIFQLSELIGQLNFDIISSKLQAEMTKHFLTEIEQTEFNTASQSLSVEKATSLLYNAFTPNIAGISGGVSRLPKLLKHLLTNVHEIERFLLVLRFVHIKGKVEIARMSEEAHSFSNTFQELIHEVNSAEQRLEKLSDIIRKHEKTGKMYAGNAGRLNEIEQRIKSYLLANSLTSDEHRVKENEKVTSAA